MRYLWTGLVLLLSLIFSAETKNIIVTGQPASAEVIRQAVTNILNNNLFIGLEQETSTRQINNKNEYTVSPLRLGEWQTLSVPLPGLLKPGAITVNVYNQPVARKDADFLVVSNEPEKIKKLGLLSAFLLEARQTMRFLYYHKNSTNKKIALVLMAENIGVERAKLHFIPALSGSNIDGLYSGHSVTKKFFRLWQNNEGYVLALDPGRAVVLSSVWLRPDEVASCLAQFTLLEGGAVRIRLVAQDPATNGLAHLLTTNTEENRNRISGVFSAPLQIKNYVLNLAWPQNITMRIGDEPFIVDSFSGRKLRGNYGLYYRYDLELTNTTDNDKIIELYFKPNGGLARGTFLIDQVLYESELAGAAGDMSEKKFYEIRVPSRSSRNLQVLTMPEPGSNYPVTLILKGK